MATSDVIRGMRERGLSYRQIQRETGLARSTISYHCVALKSPALDGPRRRELNLSNSVEEILLQLLLDGIRSTDVADALSIPIADVRLYADRNNITRERTPELLSYARLKRRRRHLKVLAVICMGGKCTVCGYNKSYKALDFHHLNPEMKDFSISSKPGGCSWASIKSEISKCVLLCSNCHREVHDDLL